MVEVDSKIYNQQPVPNECEAWLPNDSNLVAEEMKFGLGWNSTSTTKMTGKISHNNQFLKVNEKRQKGLSNFV